MRKKVLIFSDCYIYGGSERLMSFLMNNEFLNQEFDVKFTFRKFKNYVEGMQLDYKNVPQEKIVPLNILSNETLFHKINCLNIPLIVKFLFKLPFFILEKFFLYSIWNLLVFIILIKRELPDLIHINNGGYPGAKSCNVLVFANYLTGNSKLVYQVNNQAMRARRWSKSCDRFISQGTDSFITASYQAKQKLVDFRQFSSDNIAVINNCIIPVSVKLSKDQICEELNIPLNSFIISQVAFLTKRKGQIELIKAANYLFNKYPLLRQNIRILLVGDGEDLLELKEFVAKHDLEKNVLFLGFRQNSQDYIAASDLFILPSISNEDMPLVILTALQLGKPIIASNFAGIAQAIQTEKNGLLIDLNIQDFDRDISDSIERLYYDETLRKKIGAAAEISFKDYTPEKYGRNLTAIYTKVLDKL